MESSHAAPLAVVTGASSGIGFELARVFAEEGFDLIVAAEDEELHPASHDLEGAGVAVEAVRVALRNELKDSGVSVTTLMPGPTDTEFFAVAEMEDTKVGAGEKDDPAEVARQGYKALIAGEERVVAGSFKNKLQVAAGRVLPDSKKAEMHREMASPGSAREE